MANEDEDEKKLFKPKLILYFIFVDDERFNKNFIYNIYLCLETNAYIN